jgi:hypothetical protein
MASGSGSSNSRGRGRGRGTKLKNGTAAMNRRLNNSFYAMNRANRVRGEKNATARASAYLPF